MPEVATTGSSNNISRMKSFNPAGRDSVSPSRQRQPLKRVILWSAVVATFFFIALVAHMREPSDESHLSSSSSSSSSSASPLLKMFVIGDWGREGLEGQREVAEAMERVAKEFGPDLILSTGDNFYKSGLSSVDDPMFESSFLNLYDGPALREVPWHAVLGNHDYGEGRDMTCRFFKNGCTESCCRSPLHQLNPALRARDPYHRWHCARAFELKFPSDLQLGGGNSARGAAARGGKKEEEEEEGEEEKVDDIIDGVEIIAFDSTPFVREWYGKSPWWDDGPGSLVYQSWEANLMELENRLALSRSKIKIVVAHHPVFTCSSADDVHQEKGMLEKTVRPLLERYGVRAYFNGHDHNMQAYLRGGIHYFTSGAGSLVRPGWGDEVQCLKDGAYMLEDHHSGFMAVTVTREGVIQVDTYIVESQQPTKDAHQDANDADDHQRPTFFVEQLRYRVTFDSTGHTTMKDFLPSP